MGDVLEQLSIQRTLLIVDDQPSVCVSLEYLLSGTGYRVFTAGSGVAAEEIVTREAVDGALIDIHMPGLSGFGACERLREHARATGRELRVWFMTGAFTRDLEKRRLEVGGLAILRKPFDLAALLDELNRGYGASGTPTVAEVSARPAQEAVPSRP